MKRITTTLKDIYQSTHRDFRFGFATILKYTIFTNILLTALLMPILSVGTSYLIRLSGYQVLTNSNIVNFALSLPGILAGILCFVIISVGIIIQIGGQIVIANQVHQKNKMDIMNTLITAIKELPKLISVGGLFVLVYFIVITPLINLNLTTSFMSNLYVPGFIMDFIYENIAPLILYTLVMLGCIVLAIRWIFALHIAIIEDKKIIESLRASGRLVKENLSQFIVRFLLFELIVFFVVGVFVFICTAIIVLITALFGSTTGLNGSLLLMLLFLQVFTFFLANLFIVPVHVIFLTQIYYQFEYEQRHKAPLNRPLIDYKVRLPFQRLMQKLSPTVLILASVCFLTVSLLFSVAWIDEDGLDDITEVTAHRGSVVKAPENTISAIEFAIEDGADYIEIDVQETKDGVIVLTHDSNLKRLTGVDVNVWELTYPELQELEVGGWYSQEYLGEKMPTLDEVIRLVHGRTKLNIEIKTHGHERALVPSVIDIIRANDFTNQCVITSTDLPTLKETKSLAPELQTGYIIYLKVGELDSLDVDFYSMEESRVSRSLITKTRMNGKQLHVWTINEVDDMERLLNMRVDNIITDQPDVLVQLIEERKNRSDLEKLFDYLLVR